MPANLNGDWKKKKKKLKLSVSLYVRWQLEKRGPFKKFGKELGPIKTLKTPHMSTNV